MLTLERLFSVLLTVLLIGYPALVYFGMQTVGPQALAGILVVLSLLRLGLQKLAGQPFGNGLWLLLAASLAGGFTLVTGSITGLKSYPVVVNCALLAAFAYSLWQPPTLIERLARLQTPELPAHAVAYTRKVTGVWCGFFIINGTVAAFTMLASDALWALYNGFISYIAMGILLGGEYWVRQRVKNNNKHLEVPQENKLLQP